MAYSRGPVIINSDTKDVTPDQQPNVLLLTKLRRLHDRLLENYKQYATPRHVGVDEGFVDLDCSLHDLRLCGDVRLQFHDGSSGKKKGSKLFHVWFNTAFVEGNYMCFEKPFVDKVNKDKKHKAVDARFKIELYLQKIDHDDQDHTGSAAADAGDALEEEEEEEDLSDEDED